MKVRVLVFFKDGVFDPQGSTLASSLKQVGFTNVTETRVGKVIDIDIVSNSVDEAKRTAEKMAEKLLANPVIEKFQVEIPRTL
jgi:phosphoribosylformylglycinamidine synthase